MRPATAAIHNVLRGLYAWQCLAQSGRILVRPDSSRIAVRLTYGWHDDAGNRFRSHGNVSWEFDFHGFMAHRHASINDQPILEAHRKFHWPLGRRPVHYPELTALGR